MEPPDDDILDVSKISFSGDFDAQTEEILQLVRLTRSEVENLQYLIDDLTQALSQLWPGCAVYPFGSIVSGLGIKTSDIDCFIQIHPMLVQPGPILVKQAKKLLWRIHHKFTQILAITTAKVPILKFQHIPTSFHCDINFTSYAGVRNSKLIAFLLNLDPRAIHLAIIVKYWSKVYMFTGTNLMPNYALTMMVIFYLQVMNILPSVETLQRSVPVHTVENWDTAYDEKYRYSKNNDHCLYTLLGGFFNYYATFDFANEIISPFVGAPLRKELFATFDNVPPEFYLYKDNLRSKVCKEIRLDTAMCVQDPFDHSRNCTVAVYKSLFVKILSYFQLALKAYVGNEKNKFLRELLSNGLTICNEQPNHPKRTLKTQNKINKRKNQHIFSMEKQYRQKVHEWRKDVRFKIRNS